jgi:uncharacterized protein YdeI (YjbR/CyaY-like superfamily)
VATAKLAAKNFSATLERSSEGLNWTIIRVPLDVAKTWGVRGQLKVKGEINGFAFRTSLFPTGQSGHILMVNKKMQAGARAGPGVTARFRLEPDTAPREVTPPVEWLAMLRKSKALAKFYQSLNYSTRHDIARWVAEGKQSETRRRRCEQLAERLLLTMEAERELPPLLQTALARNPRAREGWERMPPSHRRAHLMGIFGYRNPESRARRLAKAVEAMLAYADKKEKTPRKV